MAHCSSKTTRTPTAGPVRFLGPAQQIFDTVQVQAAAFLDTYCPNWRTYERPSSYVLPPIFRYKHAEVNDEDFEEARRTHAALASDRNPDPVIKDRLADSAEHMVYDAVQQAISDGIQAPFIAVHNLNVDKVQSRLPLLFPHVNMAEMKQKFGPFREYDFVLIGPKIGMIVIEVKSSSFKKNLHFADRDVYLPDDYRRGLAQLESADQLVGMLQELTSIAFPGHLRIQKVLFTPNLDKSRFSKWTNGRHGIKSAPTEGGIDKVITWFIDDVAAARDNRTRQPPLYKALRKVLESGTALPACLYESWALVLAALTSTTGPHHMAGYTVLNLDKLDFCETAAVLRVHDCISIHDPRSNLCPKMASQCRFKRAPKAGKGPTRPEHLSSVVFFTPDQLAALRGPNKQFIVGAAGTGKTILLQAKALDLLRNGMSVLVLAPECYTHAYTELFSSHGYHNYKVLAWPRDSELASFNEYCGRLYSSMSSKSDFISVIYERIRDSFRSSNSEMDTVFGWITLCDHVMIDDAFDEAEDFFRSRSAIASLATMAYARIARLDKVVWIALDSYTDQISLSWFWYLQHKQAVTWLLRDANSDPYSVAVLRHVMRCSEDVFSAAYDPEVHWQDRAKPLMGHKMQGKGTLAIRQHRKLLSQALDLVSQYVIKELWSVWRIQHSLDHVVVIVDRSLSRNLVQGYLQRQCQARRSDPMALDPTLTFFRAMENNMGVLVRDSYNVSSLEWPIVIFTACLPNAYWDRDFTYERYRAMTRATTKVTEVIMTYDRADVQLPEDVALDTTAENRRRQRRWPFGSCCSANSVRE